LVASYGMEFLENAYLYHVGRKDHRHNFSVYFYYFYLISEGWQGSKMTLVAFLPQLALVLVAGLAYADDLAYAMFLQTFFFVTFNKVCTSQVRRRR
jgi:phosphatidylinositol glycan class M